jgi:protein ImuA
MLDPGRLDALRRTLAQLDPKSAGRQRPRLCPLGIASVDTALGGGLAVGMLHDIAAAAPADMGAATGFAVALAARMARSRSVLWIQQEVASCEAGDLYGPGFALFGLTMARLIVLRVPRSRDALWAMEEALASGALAGVVTELATGGADLTATRRLSLAAAGSDTLALLLHHHPPAAASAAATRWQIAALPGPRDAFGGLGTTAFTLSLTKNRHGPTGRWHITWDHHERVFTATLSGGVAAAPVDRSGRALLVRSA